MCCIETVQIKLIHFSDFRLNGIDWMAWTEWSSFFESFGLIHIVSTSIFFWLFFFWPKSWIKLKIWWHWWVYRFGYHFHLIIFSILYSRWMKFQFIDIPTKKKMESTIKTFFRLIVSTWYNSTKCGFFLRSTRKEQKKRAFCISLLEHLKDYWKASKEKKNNFNETILQHFFSVFWSSNRF